MAQDLPFSDPERKDKVFPINPHLQGGGPEGASSIFPPPAGNGEFADLLEGGASAPSVQAPDQAQVSAQASSSPESYSEEKGLESSDEDGESSDSDEDSVLGSVSLLFVQLGGFGDLEIQQSVACFEESGSSESIPVESCALSEQEGSVLRGDSLGQEALLFLGDSEPSGGAAMDHHHPEVSSRASDFSESVKVTVSCSGLESREGGAPSESSLVLLQGVSSSDSCLEEGGSQHSESGGGESGDSGSDQEGSVPEVQVRLALTAGSSCTSPGSGAPASPGPGPLEGAAVSSLSPSSGDCDLGTVSVQGTNKVTVSLAPDSMGKVQVTLMIDPQGQIRGRVEAAQPQTLALLQERVSDLTVGLVREGFSTQAEDFSFSSSPGGDFSSQHESSAEDSEEEPVVSAQSSPKSSPKSSRRGSDGSDSSGGSINVLIH